MSKLYTEKEKAIIYASEGLNKDQLAARLPGRKPDAVYEKARQLGVRLVLKPVTRIAKEDPKIAVTLSLPRSMWTEIDKHVTKPRGRSRFVQQIIEAHFDKSR